MTERVNGLIDNLCNDYILSVTENNHKYSHIFQHEDGRYKIIDWGDRDNIIKIDTKLCLEDDKCEFILKCQLRQGLPHKLRPYFFFDKGGVDFFNNIPNLRSLNKTGNKLMYWRGNQHIGQQGVSRERVLSGLSKYLNPDYEQTRKKETYSREMARSRIALSIPGLGKACHREFEAFAVGTPVIMPRYRNVYYDPIIPNHHYISVETDPNNISVEAMIERYHEVVDDEDFLKYVSDNAMSYYDKYIRFDQSIIWMRKLLEL